jgi:uncharacterized protein (TIGR00369 family)
VNKFAELVERWGAGEVELAPITGLLGVRPVSVGEGEAVLTMEAGERLHNAMGTLHGGVFLDLADVAMGVAMATVLEPGEGFATVQSGVSYLRAVKDGRLEAAARVVQRGRTTGHLECEITDGEGRQVARVTSVCAIRRGER